MRFASLIPLCLLVLAACGEHEEQTTEFGLCSDATLEEQETMWRVYGTFCELGYEPHSCVVFVRSPDQEVLDGLTWVELPDRYRIDARNAAEGWRGCYLGGVVYVRRYGEAEPYLESLLIHELAHSVGFQHGSAMKAFESRVEERMHRSALSAARLKLAAVHPGATAGTRVRRQPDAHGRG
jgi:hypothetical protein